jgi:hypothetical protein
MYTHSTMLDSEHATGYGDAAAAASAYIADGFSPIPVPYRSKGPTIPEWSRLRLTDQDVELHFVDPVNIGLLLGGPSNGLIDVDLDSPEAVALAATLLPPTGAIFGRESRRRSHYLYIVTGRLDTEQFRDIDRSMQVEIRSTGAQTIVPPSRHPGGETVQWDEHANPAAVSAAELRASVRKLATASLLVRHYPPQGSRHEAMNALIGGLLRAGWTAADVETFVLAVGRVASDEEAITRPDGIGTTIRRLAAGQTATGWRRLAELIGDDIVGLARTWLGVPEERPRTADDSRQHEPTTEHALTDIGNAERLVSVHGQDIRYCRKLGGWLIWNGVRWIIDESGQIWGFAKDALRSIYAEAATAENVHRQRELADHAKKSASEPRLRAMIKLAVSAHVHMTAATLDSKAHPVSRAGKVSRYS